MHPPDLTDSVPSTSASLIELEFPLPPDANPDPVITEHQHPTESRLRERIERIAFDDLVDLETMLACQAQLLHRMFTRVTSLYARSPHATHGNVALKAQNHCRQTISALTALKTKQQSFMKREFSPSELYRKE